MAHPIFDDVPENVLAAMELEDEPLPECVAAAWECYRHVRDEEAGQ